MLSSDWSKIIGASVVPVVIISACGLLCLAFYSRLAAIVSRLRAFQRERLHEQELVSNSTSDSDADANRRRLLIAQLGEQTQHVMRRAHLIRLTLFFLLLTIALLIACSLMLGLTVVASAAAFVALPLFGLGLLSMLLATLFAMLELKTALHPAELEQRFVSQILGDQPQEDGNLT